MTDLAPCSCLSWPKHWPTKDFEMTNKIMEMADALASAEASSAVQEISGHNKGAAKEAEQCVATARAALQAEVERVEQELDLLSEGWRVANSDGFHKSRELVSLRVELAGTEAVNKAAALEIVSLRAELDAAKADAVRYHNFIDAMCNEVFDTWTTGYKMQQTALNIRDAATRRAAMKGQPK